MNAVSSEEFMEDSSSMHCRVIWEGHGVYQRFYGMITAAYFDEIYDEVQGDLRAEGVSYVISDFLDAQLSPYTGEDDALAFAELEKHRFYGSPDIVYAVVAKEPGMVALVQMLKSRNALACPLEVFPTVIDARKWIAANPRIRRARLIARAAAHASRLQA